MTQFGTRQQKTDRQTDIPIPAGSLFTIDTPRHLQGSHLLSLTIEHLAQTLDKQNLPVVKGKIREVEF